MELVALLITTEGLLPFIENKGQVYGSWFFSAVTMADFDAAVKSLDKYQWFKRNGSLRWY